MQTRIHFNGRGKGLKRYLLLTNFQGTEDRIHDRKRQYMHDFDHLALPNK